ncbi:hypothetical protein KQ51_01270 [Candidatus Izimaplasma bacterium HR1]|jgi:uncharacterized membrane protein YczE|uniref:YczE/YyaS/YitT family protein n=1 Tax=Candidatus Izimoplasma sp. HR1 TaxID=1541959 RepID=UPI0004F8368B|nr:hypothetical protein KQ51_01270 [Candidatus Izimaplasma bacterium HR1]
MGKKILKELSISRIIKYVIGMVLIAFSVTLMLKSDIGNSSWDTLHYSMEHLFNISFGMATIIVATFFMIMVIILNRDFKYLLMWIPVLIVGPLIDLFIYLVDAKTVAEIFTVQILYFTLGITLLPLGGAFLLISNYPAGVFDEFNLAVVHKLKLKSLVPTRVIMELTAVLIAFILGRIAGIGYGKIGVGTLIFAITVGIFLKTYLKLFERIGLYENQQTN